MGVALFGVIVILFFVVQSAAFIKGVMTLTPEYAGRPFSFSMLDEPLFQERLPALASNGDLVSLAALWSGVAGVALILLTVLLWKRASTAAFLGLHTPRRRPALVWTGVFLLLALAIEGLSHLSPVFRTDFMQHVLASTTDTTRLVLGVGILAPLFEELLLRGLLFGSVRHILDEHASVAITAGVFAVMHMQYNWTIMLLILPLGVVLGYARSRSGSIWLPVLLHVLNNMASIALA